MITSKLDARTIELSIQKFNTAAIVDEFGPDIEWFVHALPERLAYQLGMTLRTPAQVLQDNSVVAEWPLTWWDHIKARLGWKHQTKQLRMKEVVTFPDYAPPRHGDRMRLYVMPSISVGMA
jgi:hypothetical protein